FELPQQHYYRCGKSGHLKVLQLYMRGPSHEIFFSNSVIKRSIVANTPKRVDFKKYTFAAIPLFANTVAGRFRACGGFGLIALTAVLTVSLSSAVCRLLLLLTGLQNWPKYP